MHVILLGATSFAANGLADRLRAAGHTCLTFGRGPVGKSGDRITGPMDQLADNPHWPVQADWILNFILLRDKSIEANEAYCRDVIRLAKRLGCRGVLHVSSVMAFEPADTITGDSPLASSHADKLFYAGVKIATDKVLLNENEGVKVVFLRPGFILGEGHVNAIVGSAAALPGGNLLVMGNPKQQFPVTNVDKVQECVLSILQKEAQWKHGEGFLSVDTSSPSRGEYIRACRSELGLGRRVWALGAWFWYPAASAGELLARAMGQKKPRVYSRVAQTFRSIRYDASSTEAKLGIGMSIDWRTSLRGSHAAQEVNFQVPPADVDLTPYSFADVSVVLFIGFGGIVKQKHLPALKQLGFKGQVDVVDPAVKPSDDINLLKDARDSKAEVVIIATPPSLHEAALDALPQSTRLVFLEKPIAVDGEACLRIMGKARVAPWKLVVLHNYRFKRNVRRMLSLLHTCNAGELRAIRVEVVAGAIENDGSYWRRQERANRTLLMDFSLHALDLAAWFAGTYRGLADISFRIGARALTSSIDGTGRFGKVPVQFHLSQGHGPYRHWVTFHFANYIVRLTFHPDTCTVTQGPDLVVNRISEAGHEIVHLLRWISSRLTGTDSDSSHLDAFREGIRMLKGKMEGGALSMESMEASYRFLSDIGAHVYEERSGAT